MSGQSNQIQFSASDFYDDSKIQGGVTYTQTVNQDGDLQLGTVASSEVSFNIVSATMSHTTGDWFTWYFKPTGQDASLNMGSFVIDSITTDYHGIWTIKAYDSITKLDKIIDDYLESVTFPITIANLFAGVCTYCNCAYTAFTGTNYNMPVKDNFTVANMTGRQIVEYIAQATGTVCVQVGNNLTLKAFGTTSTYDFDDSNYTNIESEIFSCPKITQLWVGLQEEDTGVTSGTGDNVYRIYNNPIFYCTTASEIQTYVDALYSYLNSLLVYTPTKIELYQDSYIQYDCGTVFSCYDEPFYVMSRKLTNKGLTFECYGNPERQVSQPTLQSSVTMLRGSYHNIVNEVDELTSEMGTKVGDDEIISKINQTPEQITIQANRLNLTGVATFSQLQEVDTKATDAQTKANSAISTVDVEYYQSTSSTSLIGGSWSTTSPTWTQGTYIWTRNKYTLKNGTITYSTASCVTGNNGEDGTGITSVTELYYVSSSSSTPSKPTSHVTTSSSTAYNRWNKMCSTYNSSYPYYYTCSEILYTTGSYGWSDVVANKGYESSNSSAADAKSKTDGLATGTTTINGGCITTGIIQSSDTNHQYSVNLDTGVATLKSANITGGTINITTDSETNDKIQLSYNEWTTKVAPIGLTLTNSDDGTTAKAQAGGLYLQRSSDNKTLFQVSSVESSELSDPYMALTNLSDNAGITVEPDQIRFWDTNDNVIGYMKANGNDNVELLVTNVTSNWTQSGAVQTFTAVQRKKYRYFILCACSYYRRRILASTIIPNLDGFWGEAQTTGATDPDTLACYATMPLNTAYNAMGCMEYIVNSVLPEGSTNYYLQVKNGGGTDCCAAIYGVY